MPDWRDEIRQRLASLELDPAREEQIVEELAQHLDDRFDELRARGETEVAARRGALDELLDMRILEAELRAERGRAAASEVALGRNRAGLLESLVHDLRYAFRSLRGSPGYTAASILTLALGIGGCTLIFSVANGVLLRPLPYDRPERLVAFWGTAPEKGLPEVAITQGLFAHYHRSTRTMEALAIYTSAGFNYTGAGEPERIEGGAGSADFFRVFGVKPLLGRTFLTGEDREGAQRVVVLSHALWKRRFDGRADIVGRPIDLNGTPRTVIGVMPPAFDFPNRSELWVPQMVDPQMMNCYCFWPIGRMKPDVTPADVSREIATITDDFSISRGEPNAKRGNSRFIAMPLSERIVGSLEKPLLVLLSGVGFVLLIACANIANLTLARGASRAREIAVRCCLGASPRRIGAQLLTESVLLSIAGASLGLVLAVWGLRGLRELPEQHFPRIREVGVDPAVLLFTISVALATGLLCGLLPAIRAGRVELQDAIRSGGKGAVGGGRRISDAFVVAQFALSLVLLAGAGLLLRSYQQLLRVDLGYRPANVLTARLQLPYPRYGTDTVVRAFYEPLLERVRSIPGVRAAGFASRIPLSAGNPQDNIIAEGREPKPGEPVLVANIRNVTPGYFEAMGTPLLGGRTFDHRDREGRLRVTVVDESLARHFWPNESAVGKRIYHQGDTSSTRFMTIVGVVANVKHNSVDETPDLQVYEPFSQRPTWSNYLIVRSTVSPEALVPLIRREVEASDPTLPLFSINTMQRVVDQSLSPRRLTNALLGGFAAVALVLAAIGIYGVMALSVSGRMKEFGIRLALGAQAGNVRTIVLRHGLLIAGVGVAIGLVGALGVTRFLRSLLFGVSPIDVPTFAAVAVVLSAAALVACYLPARRATRSDPIVVLRTE